MLTIGKQEINNHLSQPHHYNLKYLIRDMIAFAFKFTQQEKRAKNASY